MAPPQESPSGEHEIGIRVFDPGRGGLHEEKAIVRFDPDESRSVRLAAGRVLGSPLKIRWERDAVRIDP